MIVCFLTSLTVIGALNGRQIAHGQIRMEAGRVELKRGRGLSRRFAASPPRCDRKLTPETSGLCLTWSRVSCRVGAPTGLPRFSPILSPTPTSTRQMVVR